MLQVWFLSLVSLVNPDWSVMYFSGHNQQLIPLNFTKDWMLQVHFIYIWLILGLTIAWLYNLPLVRYIQKNRKFQTVSQKSGCGCSRELVTDGKWSLTRGGHRGRFDCITKQLLTQLYYCTWTHNHLVAATFIVWVYICTPQFHGNLLNGNAFLLLFWSRIDCKKFETGDLL